MQTAPVGPTPITLKEVSEIAEHIAKVIGLVAAGIWAYFNFVKGRTYYPRLEITVSGEIRTDDKRKYLVPRITLKNIGQAKIPLIQEGSGYRIWIGIERVKELDEMVWIEGKPVHSMFERHGWIEPGESIFDETRLIPLPTNCIAAKIEARLVARVRRFPPKNTVWNSWAIVGPEGKKL